MPEFFAKVPAAIRVLLAVAVAAAAPAAPIPSALLDVIVHPRGLDLNTADFSRFKMEIYDPEAGEVALSTYHYSGLTYDASRRGDPVYFEFTDSVAGVAFTGYVAWNFGDQSNFTYPVDVVVNYIAYSDTYESGCNPANPNVCSIHSNGYFIADDILSPSYMFIGALSKNTIDNRINVEFLDNNVVFTHAAYLFEYAEVPAFVNVVFGEHGFSGPSGDETITDFFPQFPFGDVLCTYYVDGYTTSTVPLNLKACASSSADPVLAPQIGSSSPGPSSTLPNGFPYPPPEDFLIRASEEILLDSARPVGFLKRALNLDSRVFTAASLYNRDPSGVLGAAPLVIAGDASAGAGQTAVVPIRILGGVSDTIGINGCVRLRPLSAEARTANVSGFPSPALAGLRFRDHLSIADDGVITYNFFFAGEMDTLSETALVYLAVQIPELAPPGDVFDVEIVTGVENGVVKTSLIDSSYRQVVPAACEGGPDCPLPVRNGKIRIGEAQEAVWVVE